MTPPLRIGNRVRIKKSGTEFVIDEISDDNRFYETRYTAKEICRWYPASLLELVEELKIGDEVEVIGQPKGVSGKPTGLKSTITAAFEDISGWGYKVGDWWYPDSSLHKISKPENNPGMTLKDSLLGRMERFAAIEKRLDEQKAANAKLRKRCHEIETNNSDIWDKIGALNAWADAVDKKIGALTKWQMEHDLEKSSRFHKGASSLYIDGTLIGDGKWHGVVCSTKESPVVSKILDEPEIKVGDWIQYVGNGIGRGNVYRVERVDDVGHIWMENAIGWYSPKQVARIELPLEIAKRLNEGRT
jgi:hypothetical protein